MASPSEQEEEGEIPVEELEAKLLSVKQALERFDDVKVRFPVCLSVYHLDAM